MRYRKKPVVIEAWQFCPKLLYGKWSCTEPPQWLSERAEAIFTVDVDAVPIVEIKTLEGTMIANPEDWIIKGIKGELYPCKPDIFAATYEPVE